MSRSVCANRSSIVLMSFEKKPISISCPSVLQLLGACSCWVRGRVPTKSLRARLYALDGNVRSGCQFRKARSHRVGRVWNSEAHSTPRLILRCVPDCSQSRMTAEGANHKHESEMNWISYKQGSSSLPRQPGSVLVLR